MKKLILSLLFLGFIGPAQTQILLEEANIEYSPVVMKLDPASNMLVLKIEEKSVGEFQSNALEFVKKSFNVNQLVQQNKDSDYDYYNVKFKSAKGHITALFDKEGDLVSSYQKFRDIAIPGNARVQILEKYKGCTFLETTYMANSRGWDIKKEQYRVKIQDGDKVRRIKINKDGQNVRLASL
jgi:hypothetical protein